MYLHIHDVSSMTDLINGDCFEDSIGIGGEFLHMFLQNPDPCTKSPYPAEEKRFGMDYGFADPAMKSKPHLCGRAHTMMMQRRRGSLCKIPV